MDFLRIISQSEEQNSAGRQSFQRPIGWTPSCIYSSRYVLTSNSGVKLISQKSAMDRNMIPQPISGDGSNLTRCHCEFLFRTVKANMGRGDSKCAGLGSNKQLSKLIVTMFYPLPFHSVNQLSSNLAMVAAERSKAWASKNATMKSNFDTKGRLMLWEKYVISVETRYVSYVVSHRFFNDHLLLWPLNI